MLTKQLLYKDINKQSVYVIRNEDTGFVKIGISKHPEKRINELSNQSGCELTLIYNTPLISNAGEVELELHKKYAASRKSGEWFNVRAVDIVEELRQCDLVVL